MLLRIGNRLKPLSPTQHRLRHLHGAPSLFLSAYGGRFYDATPNNFQATNSGGVTAGVGPWGPVASFDGVAGNVSLAGLPTLTKWTWSAWVRPTVACNGASGSANQSAYGNLAIQGGGSKGIWLHNGKLDLFSGGADHLGVGLVPINVWSHVAITADGGTVTFYLNGRPDGATFSMTVSLQFTQIGADTPGGGEPFAGLMDLVQIFPRALSPAEIAVEYADPWWRLRRRRAAGILGSTTTFFFGSDGASGSEYASLTQGYVASDAGAGSESSPLLSAASFTNDPALFTDPSFLNIPPTRAPSTGILTVVSIDAFADEPPRPVIVPVYTGGFCETSPFKVGVPKS